MNDLSPSTGRIERLRAIARQVRDFAEKEAESSRLPGQDQGPADAYRHLVGVAELSRRAGPLLSAAMAERNEWASTEAMLRSILDGRPVAASNTPAARSMDRHNNLLAVGMGATAKSTEEVVMRARSMMERAIQTTGGSGRGGTPYWRESRYWSEGSTLADWSSSDWSDTTTAPHFEDYRQRLDGGKVPERESTATGGEVQVRPYMREGHPVSGYTRSSPGR
ncbi:MAG: hypothetical protein ING82_13840 [Roseomonas sp.]|jgi:hypothetical protein|nr:hypothetical protein [Roseomonas sp.]